MTRKKIGLLGGNFNPIHNAHLMLAREAARSLQLDKVLLMPENLPPHQDKKTTIAPEHRIQMIKLAIAPFPELDLELCEIERGGKSYTYDTMRDLTAKNPDTDYFFIVGSDMVDYLPKWYKIDELVKLVQFVAFRRNKAVKSTNYPVKWLDTPILKISSTQIRENIARGIEPVQLLPEPVLDYIEKNQLYRS